MGGQKQFVILHTLCTICAVSGISSFERKVDTECICPATPECANSTNGTFINLYHTTATGPNDVLHYITTTWGFPGMLVARTSLNATFNLNLTKFLTDDMEGSVTFEPDAHYVYAFHFLQLIEYNDVNDTDNLSEISTDEKYWRFHNLGESVTWSNSSIETSVENNHIVFTIQNSTNNHDNGSQLSFQGNGSLSFQIDITGDSSRTEHLPHLQYTANTSLFQFTIDNMITAFDDSRFAVELLLVTSDKPTKSKVNVSVSRSIDDEHTPGSFQVVDVTTRDPDQVTGAYLQWKPVAYKAPSKKVQSTTRAKHYPIGTISKDTLTSYGSLASAYFGDSLISGVTRMGLNVSFGLSQDKFYMHSNYTIWVMTAGYGQAPIEEVSSLVLIVISVGFGIPVLLILFGGVGVCVHRGRKNRDGAVSSEYSAIN